MTSPKVYIEVKNATYQIPEDMNVTEYSLVKGVRARDSITVTEDDRHDDISVSVWTEYEGASLHFTRAQFKSFLEMLLDRFIGGLEVTPKDAEGYNATLTYRSGLPPRPR